MLKYKSFILLLLQRFVFFPFLIAVSVVMVVSSGCIRRNNPQDPLNYHESIARCPQDTIDALRLNVGTVMAGTDSLVRRADIVAESLHSDSLSKKGIIDSNQAIKNVDAAVVLQNQVIEQWNNGQVVADSLKHKTSLDTLRFLPPMPVAGGELPDKLAADSVRLASLFSAYSIACPGNADTIKSFKDSVSTAFGQKALYVDSVLKRMRALSNTYDSIAFAISGFNDTVKNQNNLITAYNDSIENIKWSAQTASVPRITSGDTLKRLVQTAKPGDTFILQGTVTVEGNLQLSAVRGTQSNHISLIGDLLTSNTLIATSGVFIDSGEYIDIRNMHISGSEGPGLKLENGSNNITLKHCVIENNNDFGVEVTASGISMDSCKIINNGMGGIQFAPPPTTYQLNLTNVLIAKNKGVGIDAATPIAYIRNVTISDNDSDGIHIVSPINSSVSVDYCIISFNKGFGIFRTQDTPSGEINWGINDCYQNSLGNLSPGIDRTPLSVDPHFVDRQNNNYSIAPGDDNEIYLWEMKNIIIGYREAP